MFRWHFHSHHHEVARFGFLLLEELENIDRAPMSKTPFEFHTDRNPSPADLAALLGAVGWGEAGAYETETLQRAIAGASFVAYATDAQGQMVGYLSALSDGVLTAFIDTLIVHPSVQRQGIGKALMATAERHFTGVPIYWVPFQDQQGFFEQQGYKALQRPLAALSKRNGME